LSGRGPLVLKLGGSAITVKEEPFKVDLEALGRLAHEIAESGVRELIIIHGGGSFGHPLAEKYGIHEGLRDRAQLRGLAETHRAMEELNRFVIEALLEEGLPAVPIPPISCFLTRSGRISRAFTGPVEAVLGLGAIPVLYGDVVMDEEDGFRILSGDQIAAYLALRFSAPRVVLALDVDGVFTKDPTRHPDAELVEVLRASEIKTISAGGPGRGIDVTGGMGEKLREMAPVAEAGIPVFFTSGKKPGNLLKALRGEKVRGTLLIR